MYCGQIYIFIIEYNYLQLLTIAYYCALLSAELPKLERVGRPSLQAHPHPQLAIQPILSFQPAF